MGNTGSQSLHHGQTQLPPGFDGRDNPRRILYGIRPGSSRGKRLLYPLGKSIRQHDRRTLAESNREAGTHQFQELAQCRQRNVPAGSNAGRTTFNQGCTSCCRQRYHGNTAGRISGIGTDSCGTDFSSIDRTAEVTGTAVCCQQESFCRSIGKLRQFRRQAEADGIADMGYLFRYEKNGSGWWK